MFRILVPVLIAVLVASCQTADGLAPETTSASMLTGPAAGAIAGDMVSRLAEQIGPSSQTTIALTKDNSEFSVALEAALKGWGYTIVSEGKPSKDVKLLTLSYSIDSADGQILARLMTPSVALGRAYTTTATGAVPSSPLSILQRS
jgi:hypothetical protein